MMKPPSQITIPADGEKPSVVTLYGSEECPYTVRARKWLEAWGVNYRWVDVDENAEAEKQIADWNGGRAVRPTLDVGGVIMVHPEQRLLRDELQKQGLLSAL